MQEYKIIFVGSMGAGKSTSIQSLSDKGVISTDVVNTDKQSHEKLLTTVGIDYGQIMLPPDTKVADSSSKEAPKELPFYLDYFLKNGMSNIVVGLTHTDLDDGYLTLDDCFDILSMRDFVFPIFAVDSRKKENVLLLVETLLALVEASIS